MESLFNEGGEATLSPEFCHDLAKKFNCSISRAEKFPVNWEQVQSWFYEKLQEIHPKFLPPPIMD
ncbi:hypothetical protein RJ641_019945 [Dillenia turbinata]|uniref:Uncharacterized protein n=1 Tax=Dillenia turbinata TaxID=194707 RepID=A0AAN8UDI5_9MAGN